MRGGPHGKHEAVEVTVKRLNAQGAEIEANPVSAGKYLTSSETASAHGIAPESGFCLGFVFRAHRPTKGSAFGDFSFRAQFLALYE